MLMMGMAPDEYKAMNEASWKTSELNDDDWSEKLL
jgi:hypothetical protein